jgi:hypothetical protein
VIEVSFFKGTQQGRLPHLRMKQSSFQNVIYPSFVEYSTVGKVEKPINYGMERDVWENMLS